MAALPPRDFPDATASRSHMTDTVISRQMTAAEVVSHLVAHECKDLSNVIDLTTFAEYPTYQGGFSDIYRGNLLDDARSQVAVKALRISILDPDPEHLKRAAQELHTWSKCRHPNIVPLLGLAAFRNRIGMISPWMESGSLPHYLRRTPDADRYRLCIQICEGLSYLHQIGIIHGDLKGDNVLVSDEGIPALVDFGNSLLTDATIKLTRSDGQTTRTAMTLRWSPVEIITGTGSRTKASDVYALGMTILEVMSGKPPYYGRSDATVMFMVAVKKEPPARPDGIPCGLPAADKVWELLLRCWSHEPGFRPSANEVTAVMKQIHISVPITHQMPLNDVVLQLELHGCKNVTNLINFSKFERHPAFHHEFGDVYLGTLGGGGKVAVKFMRIPQNDDMGREDFKHSAHEIYVLSKCNHPNILGLLGFALQHDRLAMVSSWALNGALPEYIARNKKATRNRCSFSSQIASAVAYLHERNIVHGSIKGPSVLIKDDRTAVLGGFGFATLANYTLQFTATTSNPAVYLPWAPPEIIEGTSGPTTQADVYSLGMTILYCMTGKAPYSGITDILTVLVITGGTYPERSMAHIPDNEHGNRLWTLLTKCWSREVSLRPTAADVERELSTITPEGLLEGIEHTESRCIHQ